MSADRPTTPLGWALLVRVPDGVHRGRRLGQVALDGDVRWLRYAARRRTDVVAAAAFVLLCEFASADDPDLELGLDKELAHLALAAKAADA